MAFQTGTQVNPQLGALDFSGFTNAAKIQADSMDQLGATIGGAITANKEKKQEKALSEQAANMVFSFAKTSEIGKQLGIENLEDAKVAVKTLGGAKPALSLLMELQEFQQGDPTTAAEMTSIGNMLQRPEFENIQFDESTGEAYMEVPNKDTLMPFDKKRVPPPAIMQNIPGFKDYGQAQRTTSEVADYAGMKIIK